VRAGLRIWPLHKEAIMKKDDLTQVKYIGASRKKSLKDLGITTTQQLYETPLDTLARIETIGPYYAKLIKNAVKELFGEVPEKTAPEVAASVEDKGIVGVKQDLIKQINILKGCLKRTNEVLKSSGKKRLYSDFKKRSKTLMKRLDGLDQKDIPISKKAGKDIIKKADALNAMLKEAGKRPKKRKYKKLSRKLRSFSKRLKRIGY
jgi:DNA uptake protein ComE-like DNA-binding protein